jgi:hypothetical protein
LNEKILAIITAFIRGRIGVTILSLSLQIDLDGREIN